MFEAAKQRRRTGQGTLLFVDEIHRFNKAQQDGFLPHMEDGTILLVGATTENPSFELNAALLSRAQVLVLERLWPSDWSSWPSARRRRWTRAAAGRPRAREALLEMADGDGRALLNLIEQVAALARRGQARHRGAARPPDAARGAIRQVGRRALQPDLGAAQIGARLGSGRRALLAGADAGGRARTRATSPGASPAWRSRISGWPIRRRRASASRRGRPTSGSASPEGELALAQAVVYLALAPKSNAAYAAYKAAQAGGEEDRVASRRPSTSSTRRRR